MSESYKVGDTIPILQMRNGACLKGLPKIIAGKHQGHYLNPDQPAFKDHADTKLYCPVSVVYFIVCKFWEEKS